MGNWAGSLMSGPNYQMKKGSNLSNNPHMFIQVDQSQRSMSTRDLGASNILDVSQSNRDFGPLKMEELQTYQT